MGYVRSCINVEKKIIKEICWELNDSKSFVSKKIWLRKNMYGQQNKIHNDYQII